MNTTARPTPENEYLIDGLAGLCKVDAQYWAKVRWYDYGRDVDTWEPLKDFPRHLVVNFLRAKRRHILGYDWQTPTPRTRRRADTNPGPVMALAPPPPCWSPWVRSRYQAGYGTIMVRMGWRGVDDALVEKKLPDS